MNSGRGYICPLCGEFEALILSKYLAHVRLIHSDKPGFGISCCGRTFKKFTSYRNHIYNYHAQCKTSAASPVNVGDGESSAVGQVQEFSDSFDESPVMVTNSESDTHTLQVAAATWVLKTREIFQIPQSSMELIVQDVDSLYQLVISSMQERVTSSLQQDGVGADAIHKVSSIICETSGLFSGLHSQYRQLQFFKDHFGLQVNNFFYILLLIIIIIIIHAILNYVTWYLCLSIDESLSWMV